MDTSASISGNRAVFAIYILSLAVDFKFSVTSWGRTSERNKHVGGVENSLHVQWLAVDIVLEPNQDYALFMAACKALGLQVVTEKDHTHIEMDRK